MSKPTQNPKSVGAYRKQNERQRHETDKAIERDREDELQGEVLAVLMSDPFADVEDLALAAGLSAATVRGLRTKLAGQLQAPTAVVRRITNQTLLDKLEDRLDRTVDAIDAVSIQRAPLRDKVYAADRLFQMRQLLKGEPTQIVSIEDRRVLNDIVPAMIREAQRRGVVLDGIARVVTDNQRGIPDSRLLNDVGAVLTGASEGSDVRGGVSEGPPQPGAQAPAGNPNEPPSGRATNTPETAGSTDP